MGDLANAIDSTPRQPVHFDPHTLQLTIGDRSTVVPDPTEGNEAMLREYLTLVAEARGVPIGAGIRLRHDDIVVLAEILDLTDGDLESHLVNLLGVSANDAADVHRRIRKHRALTAAAAVSVSGFLLLGARSLPSAAPVPTVHTTGTVTTQPTTTVDNADNVETSTSLAVATTTPPSSHAQAPSSAPDTDIGSALVIERGQQPDDPNTNIDNTVTYER